MKKFCYLAIFLMACLATSCEPIEPATSNKVKTGLAENITTTSAILHGSIDVNLLEYESVEYGVMISTDKTEMNERKGWEEAVQYLVGNEIKVEITWLKPNTEYFYCTYLLLNNQQYEFGAIKSFTTLEAIKGIGEFSVSSTQKVTFAPGNLQYKPSTQTWQFAPNQIDYIGENNTNIDSLYNDYIDLFGWGTGANPICDTAKVRFVDWGSNRIGNEGENAWRTLSEEEWEHLIYERENADSLVAVAQVNGVNGLMLFPDKWIRPQGIKIKAGFAKLWSKESYADYQTITAAEWKKIEEIGVVFLPAAGYRTGKDMIDIQYFGQYWSNKDGNNNNAICIAFYSGGIEVTEHSRYAGRSVRLVKNCE